MPHVEKSFARRRAHATLSRLAQKVASLRLDEFDLQKLRDLGIHIDPITLNETSQDSRHKLSYFAPFPSYSVREPNDDDLEEPLNGIDDEMGEYYPFTRPVDRSHLINWHISCYISRYILEAKRKNHELVPWSYKDVRETIFGYAGLSKDEQPGFGCYDIGEIKDPAFPHVKLIIYNSIIATISAILYGELIPIFRIMAMQLVRRKFSQTQQTISPVLVVSIMAFQARVIEAFYQDHKLVLRPSEMYDLTHGNHNAFNTFALWYIGKSIEITKSEV